MVLRRARLLPHYHWYDTPPPYVLPCPLMPTPSFAFRLSENRTDTPIADAE